MLNSKSQFYFHLYMRVYTLRVRIYIYIYIFLPKYSYITWIWRPCPLLHTDRHWKFFCTQNVRARYKYTRVSIEACMRIPNLVIDLFCFWIVTAYAYIAMGKQILFFRIILLFLYFQRTLRFPWFLVHSFLLKLKEEH